MGTVKTIRRIVKRVRISSLDMNDADLKEYVGNLPVLPFTGIHLDDKETCDIAVDFLKEGDLRQTIKMAFEYLKKITI